MHRPYGGDRSAVVFFGVVGATALEYLPAEDGSAVIGWVGQGVLYGRLVGDFSAELGEQYAARFTQLVAPVTSVRYFVDAGALRRYDMIARSAFIRAVLANRKKFEALVFLSWGQEISAATRALVASTRGGEVLINARKFELRLIEAAPGAKERLDPKTWIRRGMPVSGKTLIARDHQVPEAPARIRSK